MKSRWPRVLGLYGVLIVAAVLVCAVFVSASAQSKAAPRFRVCADPENMPFSNDKLEGFENRIAELVAKDFGATPSYIWWGQRRGFIRNTINATLEEGRCDIVIGVPHKYDLVLTTRPYYRSTYVFVYPKGKVNVRSLDDPALKKLKIGVHLIGDDYTNPPPVHELARRGIVSNVVGFDTFYSDKNPPSAIIDAVAQGRIDLAVVWGPVGGYFASRQHPPMQLVPIPPKKGDLPFSFDIAMGVKQGNEPLRKQLQQVLDRRHAEIVGILRRYGVPLVGEQ